MKRHAGARRSREDHGQDAHATSDTPRRHRLRERENHGRDAHAASDTPRRHRLREREDHGQDAHATSGLVLGTHRPNTYKDRTDGRRPERPEDSSPGQRPGNKGVTKYLPALKGQNRFRERHPGSHALTGRPIGIRLFPRALPGAVVLRPFGPVLRAVVLRPFGPVPGAATRNRTLPNPKCECPNHWKPPPSRAEDGDWTTRGGPPEAERSRRGMVSAFR